MKEDLIQDLETFLRQEDFGKIGRASCRERGVDLGGRRIIKKKKKPNVSDGFMLIREKGPSKVIYVTNKHPEKTLVNCVWCGVLLTLRTTVFFFQAEDGIRDLYVTGVQTCALPISTPETSSSTKESSERRSVA